MLLKRVNEKGDRSPLRLQPLWRRELLPVTKHPSGLKLLGQHLSRVKEMV